MIGIFIRSIWRVLVLALGLGLAYGVFLAFPYLDRRLPVSVAILILYIGVAYFGLPAIIRTWRLIIRPNHIPLYVTTPDGWPADPVNIAIICKSRHSLKKAMRQAGWYEADRANLKNSVREAYAIVFDLPYPTAPFSPLYLFNRPFDLGFQIPYGPNGSPRHRHHVRFWQLVDQDKDKGHFSFWAKHFKAFIGRQKTIWIGAAIDDVNAHGLRWRNLQITHSNHPLHWRERDYIIDTLAKAGLVEQTSEIQAGEPFNLRGQNFRTSFVCDGRIKIVELKR